MFKIKDTASARNYLKCISVRDYQQFITLLRFGSKDTENYLKYITLLIFKTMYTTGLSEIINSIGILKN